MSDKDKVQEQLDAIMEGQAERVTIDGATVTYRKTSELIEAFKFSQDLNVNPFKVLRGNSRKVTH